ncbi:LuxR C-terminal-related transcriptional regulator [Microbacterium sp. DT81.1]|uniref:helix-turn-helix transcriptional regulator n=1 Tax=Microbacterium sp. DT81.1 TaxID=3393413 RepID=UPI003CF63E35
MPQILGRDALIARIGAALERAGRAGGGTVIVSGPAGAGTTAAVAEALRLRGAKARGASAPPSTFANAPSERIEARWIHDVQWIDDVQRAPDLEALARALEQSSGAADAATGLVVLSGRAPWGAALASLQRAAMRADGWSVVDVDPLAPEVAVEIVTAGEATASPGEHSVPVEAATGWGRACGSRLRLLAAVLRTDGDLAATAVSLAVDDLLADLSPAARRLLEAIAIGGPEPRAAAVEGVWARERATSGAGFDETLAELVAAGFVDAAPSRLRCSVPVVCDVIAARLGAGRAALLHVAYVEALTRLGGVDPREIADHVGPVADRLPVEVAAAVLTASAERRTAASDHLDAVADLAIAADLLESAAASGSVRERAAAFEALSALGAATYYAGDLDGGERVLRRAERFAASASPVAVADLQLFRTYIRADRGQHSEIPPLHETGSRHSVDDIVIRLFLVDRGDDQAELEAVCDELVALDRDDAEAVDRGAAALGRSVRASLAGDLDAALAEAERALSIAGDTSATLYGGVERELIRLCVLKGDLDAALRHADGDGYDFAGRVPRIVEASNVVHAASVALLQGDIADATERAERALTMTRLAPVPRGLVRCVAWVALLGAMRGDMARAKSLLAEAARAFPLDENLRLGAIVQLARVQLALRDGGPVPPSVALRLERTEGSSRLLLPVLLARLGLQSGDDATVALALAELDRIGGSPPAEALAERIRALRLVPTRHRPEAADRLGASAAELERLGFRGLAAETRLEWAELAAEAADPAARTHVVDLVHYFDAQGLDDWGDRARRLARTLGVRVGGRRGGTDQLTRREAEVVELVLDGMSNAEVASRLFLSERTVETHLQHVYRRLGVDSRLGLVTRLGAPGDNSPEH